MPSIGSVRYVVAPCAVVELAPVVRLWEATGGDVSALRVDRLPICSTSMWTRPAVPDPSDVPLRLHFDVKAALGFDHAVISRFRIEVVRRSRIGDMVGHHQVLRSIGAERSTALGWGRSWEIDHVLTDADGNTLQTETFTAVGYQPGRGSRRSNGPARSTRSVGSSPVAEAGPTIGSLSRAAAACRVWAAVHHDPRAARRAGLPGVIACTQHLAALVEQAGRAERAGLAEQAGRAERAGLAEGAGMRRGATGAAFAARVQLDLRMNRPVFATRFA